MDESAPGDHSAADGRNVIPPSVSIWDAAGPAQSLGFTLVGTLFIVPFVLMYTAFAYWVFRGKVRRGEGYH